MSPVDSVSIDRLGNIYGVTSSGGSQACRYEGCGVVYQLAPPKKGARSWKYTELHVFEGQSRGDGAVPNGGLLVTRGGTLYGTTTTGGDANAQCPYVYDDLEGCGTVFKLSPEKSGKWKYEILYSFQNPQDGTYPNTRLVIDQKGVLYGTTQGGGLRLSDGVNCMLNAPGCGTVFKLAPPAKGGGVGPRPPFTCSTARRGCGPMA